MPGGSAGWTIASGLVTVILASSCYSGLVSNAPFPCALDQTCPAGFQCQTPGGEPVEPILGGGDGIDGIGDEENGFQCVAIDAGTDGGVPDGTLAGPDAKGGTNPGTPDFAWYLLDETSGSVAHDSSSNGYDITVSGVTWKSGASFDGTGGGGSIEVSNALRQAPVTITAWLTPAMREDESDNDHGITPYPPNAVSGDVPGLSGYGVGLNVWNGGSALVVEEASSTLEAPGNRPFVAGTEYFVAASMSPTETNVYVDGLLVQETSTTTPETSSTTMLYLGLHNDDTEYGTKRFYAGRMRDVRIYKRALAASDIVGLASAGPATGKASHPPADAGHDAGDAASCSPPARSGASIAYDSARGVTVLFGGCAALNCNDGPWLNDVWEWNGESWTQAENGQNGPVPRASPAMAFDPNSNMTVLFGGAIDGSETDFGDTWGWDGSSWTELVSNGSGPSARNGASMVWDENLGELVLFGGNVIGFEQLNDTWLWNGAVWSESETSSSPSARAYFPMIYDPTVPGEVIFGGTGTDQSLGDTWTFSDGQSWQEVSLFGSSPPASTPGTFAMVYDSAYSEGMLVDTDPSTNTTTTWLYLNDGTWTAEVGTSPPGTSVMAYDSQRDVVVYFGGQSNGNPLAETWEWRKGTWGQVTPSCNGSGNDGGFDDEDGGESDTEGG